MAHINHKNEQRDLDGHQPPMVLSHQLHHQQNANAFAVQPQHSGSAPNPFSENEEAAI